MRSVRPSLLATAALLATLLASAPGVTRAGDFPEPSPYPISWELRFEHSKPKRIVVKIPGVGSRAFWYMTYSVTNESQDDQTFLPVFEMLTKDGKIHRSDKGVPAEVFREIKSREGNRFLLPSAKVGGVLRVGEDQARDGVAIWPEPMSEMGSFSIFVAGLSGEAVTMKMVDGKPVRVKPEHVIILRKTLQLNYVIYGDDVRPDIDEVNVKPEVWVMR